MRRMTTTEITNYLKSVKQYFYDCPNAELSLEIGQRPNHNNTATTTRKRGFFPLKKISKVMTLIKKSCKIRCNN